MDGVIVEHRTPYLLRKASHEFSRSMAFIPLMKRVDKMQDQFDSHPWRANFNVLGKQDKNK